MEEADHHGQNSRGGLMATLPGSETVPLKIDRDDLETFAPVLEARYTDEGAIKLVEGDVARAQAYLDQKQWNLHSMNHYFISCLRISQ